MPVSLPPVSAHQLIADVKGLDAGPVAARHAKADAAEQFEAFVLQSFIQEMLPKEAQHVFGSGLAGDIWRSLLSEKFAAELAERSPLGIADLVRVKDAGADAARETASLRASDRIAELIGAGGLAAPVSSSESAIEGS